MLINLKSAIAARGWTQVDFALDQRITPSVLSEIIHERRQPSAHLRARLATALNVDEDWIFSTFTKIPPPKRWDETASKLRGADRQG